MKNLRSIILAAGKGTRMKSLLPKVLHPVCGKPVITYVLDVVQSLGAEKTFVVLGHQRDQVAQVLPETVKIIQQKKLLGTADAVRSAETYFRGYNGDVLLLCGDTPLLSKKVIRSLLQKHRKSGSACTVLTAVVHEPHGYGRILRGIKGKIWAIREEKDASAMERAVAEINVGVYCFQSRALYSYLKKIRMNPSKKEYYLTDIIELMAESGEKISSVETENAQEGFGINDRKDLAVVESVLRKRLLDAHMEQGVTIEDPATTYIQAGVKIGRDTLIRPCTYIERGVKIGNDCRIGPFARLREGVQIGANVEVGNYTEISRSRIGPRSFIKHFSFLGDALIGARVNIGAGTVTANFDGKNKHKTKIADGAFIGSDAILVAPVSIGRNAKVGAGSVLVRKTVPRNRTAVGVPARVIK